MGSPGKENENKNTETAAEVKQLDVKFEEKEIDKSVCGWEDVMEAKAKFLKAKETFVANGGVGRVWGICVSVLFGCILSPSFGAGDLLCGSQR